MQIDHNPTDNTESAAAVGDSAVDDTTVETRNPVADGVDPYSGTQCQKPEFVTNPAAVIQQFGEQWVANHDAKPLFSARAMGTLAERDQLYREVRGYNAWGDAAGNARHRGLRLPQVKYRNVRYYDLSYLDRDEAAKQERSRGLAEMSFTDLEKLIADVPSSTGSRSEPNEAQEDRDDA